MKKIVLASNNQGKLGEFRSIFSKLDYDVVPQGELGVGEAEETGLSYIENAIIKARLACEVTQLPAIGDDSGLSVNYLHGAPGIYSARYAGGHHDTVGNIAKLLDALEGVPSGLRKASFHCVLAFMQHAKDPVPIIAHGKWDGVILEEPRGSGGFGYDPVFFVESHDCAAAELPALQKNAISHRAKAMASLMNQIKG